MIVSGRNSCGNGTKKYEYQYLERYSDLRSAGETTWRKRENIVRSSTSMQAWNNFDVSPSWFIGY